MRAINVSRSLDGGGAEDRCHRPRGRGNEMKPQHVDRWGGLQRHGLRLSSVHRRAWSTCWPRRRWVAKPRSAADRRISGAGGPATVEGDGALDGSDRLDRNRLAILEGPTNSTNPRVRPTSSRTE